MTKAGLCGACEPEPRTGTSPCDLPDCPECEGDTMPAEFTPDEIRLCHEATEFDHQCRVCTAEDGRPDEAVPGTDF